MDDEFELWLRGEKVSIRKVDFIFALVAVDNVNQEGHYSPGR